MCKQFSATFKAQVVHDLLKEEKSVAQLAAEYGVHPTQLGKWKALTLQGLLSLFEERAEVGALKTAHEAQVTTLYAEIGRLTTQAAWLKKTWPATWIGMSASRWWNGTAPHCRALSKPTS